MNKKILIGGGFLAAILGAVVYWLTLTTQVDIKIKVTDMAGNALGGAKVVMECDSVFTDAGGVATL